MYIPIQAKAQSESKNALLQMIDEDRTTVDAIAEYDAKIQRDIFQVAQTPEVLNKMEELQTRSKDQFRAIIIDYDHDAQAAFYEMARYPNLIADLVINGKPSTSEVNNIVSNYPEDIHETAKKYARIYFDVFLRIDKLNSEIDRAFQSYLEPYNPQTRESVNALLAYPEIVSILAEDKDFTSLLGEVYSEDQEWVISNLNKISQELAEQKKEDLDAYKNQIQSDPEAYNEMLDASEKYARENNESRYESSTDPIIDVRIVNSYPFWFGHPYWYSDPYWRPLPFYYHTGFYRNHYGNVVFIGLPSYHFMHWQTYNHPTLFPHLSYNYYSYYENHYMNRYRNSNRPIPHNGFYRSIELNVVNNPRVNNSKLERIDQQRGNNIVRRPNIESGSNGTYSRRGNATINRGENQQRSFERPGGVSNRREYNAVNPGRSEGSINRSGSGIGNGTIDRQPSPSSVTPSYERSQQGSSTNRGNNENPRFNPSNNGRNDNPSATRQPSSYNAGSRVSPGNTSQSERSATPARREASPSQKSAVPDRTSRRAERREVKATNKQSENRRSGRER